MPITGVRTRADRTGTGSRKVENSSDKRLSSTGPAARGAVGAAPFNTSDQPIFGGADGSARPRGSTGRLINLARSFVERRVVKRIIDCTTRSLLAALPIVAVACASESHITHRPGRDIDVVNMPGVRPADLAGVNGASGPSRRPAHADLGPADRNLGYDVQGATTVSFGDRPERRAPGQDSESRSSGRAAVSASSRPSAGHPRGTSRGVTMIGLYGEIAPDTSGESDPYDGNRNLTQITFADEGACFDPDVDPTGEWLVFASTRHRDTADLYVKSTTGKTITQITTDPADDVMPSFDPTGKRLAFASNRDGNWNIFLTTLDGGRDIQLTTGSEDSLHPTWSPDGRYVAYCKFGAQSGRWEIWAVEVEKPGVHSFLDYGLFPRWCPDVTRGKILFQRSRQRGSRFHAIWTIDYVNGEAMYPTEIVSAANAAAINPTWSPDGRRIAFVTIVDPDQDTGTPEQSDIWVVNSDGTGRATLTNGEFANFQPVWASDGTVYFVSNRSGKENIWAVGAGGVARTMPDREGIVNVDPDQEGPFDRP